MKRPLLLLPLLALALPALAQDPATNARKEPGEKADCATKVVLMRFNDYSESSMTTKELCATQEQIAGSPTWNPSLGTPPPMGVADALRLARPTNHTNHDKSLDLSSICLQRIPDTEYKLYYLFTWNGWNAVTIDEKEKRLELLHETIYTAVLMNGIQSDAIIFTKKSVVSASDCMLPATPSPAEEPHAESAESAEPEPHADSAESAE